MPYLHFLFFHSSAFFEDQQIPSPYLRNLKLADRSHIIAWTCHINIFLLLFSNGSGVVAYTSKQYESVPLTHIQSRKLMQLQFGEENEGFLSW